MTMNDNSDQSKPGHKHTPAHVLTHKQKLYKHKGIRPSLQTQKGLSVRAATSSYPFSHNSGVIAPHERSCERDSLIHTLSKPVHDISRIYTSDTYVPERGLCAIGKETHNHSKLIDLAPISTRISRDGDVPTALEEIQA